MYSAKIEQYFRPASVAEALDLANQWGDRCMFMAGGMSLMQGLKSRLLSPEYLIDLNDILELKGITRQAGVIRIGAMTRYRIVAENQQMLAPFQALCDAASRVGDRQVRNRGTLGGSLAWNYVSACTPVAALACGAQLNILRADGSSEKIPIDDFLQGPLTTSLEPGDLLLDVELHAPTNASGSAYCKWGVVKDALPVIGVAVYLAIDTKGRCLDARIAVGGLPFGPERAAAAEAHLTGGVDIGDSAAMKAAARIAAQTLETSDDPWISADYKSHLIERLSVEMLALAALRAKEAMHA